MKLLNSRRLPYHSLNKLCSCHCWTYFLRTLPDTAELLEPIERAINEVLISAVTDRTVTKWSATTLVFLCAREALDSQIL